jgi:Rrf2 family protein
LIPASETAEALGAPANYLSKTLRQLARRGLLRSSRGPRGGFELAVDVDRLTAADVVEAVDEVTSVGACLMGVGVCDPSRPCPAHERWSALRAHVLEPMERTTIAELMGGHPGPSRTPTTRTAPER